jgi:hypothetical protein
MKMSEPDFYLASTEGYEMKNPRRCWRIKRLATDNRNDLLLIKIEPPLIGQRYGLGGLDIDFVLIAPRHQGRSLFPISEWPLCVHIARILIENPESCDVLRENEFESIAWAELYRTEEDARLKVM